MCNVDKLKSFILSVIVPEGWSISFGELSEGDLIKLRSLTDEAIKQRREEEE